MPERIQQKRTAGWRKPANTVSVARPSRWGNPFTIDRWGLDTALALFRDTALGGWNPVTLAAASDSDIDDAHRLASEWNKRIGGHPVELMRVELRGKNLMCFCPLGQPCHADVLLELANGPGDAR